MVYLVLTKLIVTEGAQVVHVFILSGGWFKLQPLFQLLRVTAALGGRGRGLVCPISCVAGGRQPTSKLRRQGRKGEREEGREDGREGRKEGGRKGGRKGEGKEGRQTAWGGCSHRENKFRQ